MKEIIEIGKKFNRLTILKEVSIKGKPRRVECLCDCGTIKDYRYNHVKTGNIKSCGCFLKNNPGAKTHAMSEFKEYKIWTDIKKRCYNKKAWNYMYYGGRGIKMCFRWDESFKNFYEDMGKRPSDYHSIDRIDNDGDYEPNNCKWVTKKEQANNRSNNVTIQFMGERYTIQQLSEITGITFTRLRKRYSKGVLEEFLKKLPIFN